MRTLIKHVTYTTALNNASGQRREMRAIARKKTGTNRRAIQKWPSFIWGIAVTKIMPMVKLCVEWLRKLLAYLDSQVNILSIFDWSKFLFCL